MLLSRSHQRCLAQGLESNVVLLLAVASQRRGRWKDTWIPWSGAKDHTFFAANWEPVLRPPPPMAALTILWSILAVKRSLWGSVGIIKSPVGWDSGYYLIEDVSSFSFLVLRCREHYLALAAFCFP